MELWERQEGETTKAFYAFTIYRDLAHERSLSKVHQRYTETTQKTRNCLRTIKGWSSKYGWVKRSQAYDVYLDGLARAEKEKEVKEMQKRHLTLGMALQAKGAERLQNLDGKDMKVRDAISAVTQGTRLERLIRGEPTEHIRGETITTIREEIPIPWENIPEVQKAVEKLRERMLKEKNADDAKTKA